MRLVFLILFSIFSLVTYAEETMPPHCKPIAVEGETVMLATEKASLVFIHNLGKGDLWITHPVSEPDASAGWSSRLQSGNWSALALDKPKFELSCIESKPGHEQQVPCAGLISLCQWSSISMPEKSTGTFWAGEDQNLSSLLEHLGGKGFALPNSSQ